MKHALRISQLVGVNSVPVIGFVWAGWPNGTALALYWCESVLMIALVALRIDMHRRATNKRGHYVETRVSRDRGRSWTSGVSTYNRVFLMTALGFAIGEAVFLAVVLRVAGWDVDVDALAGALRATAAFLVVGFALDTIGLRHRPFSWIRRMSDAALGRVLVLLLVVALGLFLTAVFDLPRAIFVVFGVLKLLSDIGTQVPQYNPDDAPGWLIRAIGALGFSGDEFRRDWRAESEATRAGHEEDEEPFDGRPSRPRKAVASHPTSRLPA